MFLNISVIHTYFGFISKEVLVDICMYVFSISSWWCIFSTVDQKMMMTAQNSSPFIYFNLFTLLCLSNETLPHFYHKDTANHNHSSIQPISFCTIFFIYI